ncbi:GNAT family N-acetyltransferase [Pseudoxanthomonas sp. CAU 1598]|uniref:GNAT family N-acetyltransferase n=2 Tax=Pseudomarimonas arenosa TaxID=2774145 RepID=A0AAW3ZLH8_9GAMM|nr:GNAT family N-acetyltransferase [Pseudomarimonas arenosa]
MSELLRLEAQFPGDRLSPRQLRYHLASPRALWRVLAASEGRLLGYLLILRHAGQHSARLYSLVVDRQHRGQGLAERLLAAAEAALVQAGDHALRLEVREDNAAAIALYRRRGYQIQGRKPGYYDDGAAALCMQRRLDDGPRPDPNA